MPIVRVLGEGLAGDRVLRDRRDPERHQQRGAVADGGDRLRHRRSDRRRVRQRIRGSRIRPSISTASMPRRSWPSSARSAFGVRVLPAAIETKTTARDGQHGLRRGAAARRHDPADCARRIRSRHRPARLPGWRRPSCRRRRCSPAPTGPANAAVVTCTYAGEITLSGQGAGGDATAVAIIGDLLAIARDRAAIVPAPVLVDACVINGTFGT